MLRRTDWTEDFEYHMITSLLHLWDPSHPPPLAWPMSTEWPNTGCPSSGWPIPLPRQIQGIACTAQTERKAHGGSKIPDADVMPGSSIFISSFFLRVNGLLGHVDSLILSGANVRSPCLSVSSMSLAHLSWKISRSSHSLLAKCSSLPVTFPTSAQNCPEHEG